MQYAFKSQKKIKDHFVNNNYYIIILNPRTIYIVNNLNCELFNL